MRPTNDQRRLLSIATMLTPTERVRVDAAGDGSFRTFHRNSVSEVVKDLKANRVGAVLVSVSCCNLQSRADVAALVREFPRIPTVALLTEVNRSTPQAMLSLGQTGLRQLVDVRDPDGWRELRGYLAAARGEDIQREALGRLSADLAGATRDCWRFFEALFLAQPHVTTVGVLARKLDVLPSTLTSRFFRARLPAPKQYLAAARLVRAARLFENPGFSVSNVANHLEYSSPQSFGRHVRAIMRLTAGQFRDRYDGEGMVEHFRQTLVHPHLDTLRQLRPISPSFIAAGPRAIH